MTDQEQTKLRTVSGGDTDARPRRGVYLLPNLITTGALFAGFYAVVAAMNGHFNAAVLAIAAAIGLDTADGRVARWTGAESDFGAQYDSLSDMLAFGVAPALVAFSWGVSALGNVGWMATFVYMACAALRLARFNVQGEIEKFTGLASPAAAAVMAALVWTLTDSYGLQAGPGPATALALVTVLLGLLMVSPFDYYSPKSLHLKGRVPFVTLVVVVLVLALTLLDPPRVLLVLFSIYALSGPATHLWSRLRGNVNGGNKGATKTEP